MTEKDFVGMGMATHTKEFKLSEKRKEIIKVLLESNIEPMVANLLIGMMNEKDKEFLRLLKEGLCTKDNKCKSCIEIDKLSGDL